MTAEAIANQEPDWIDAKGRKVPASMISDMDRVIEDAVTTISMHGVDLMNRVARYRGHAFDDVNALMALLAEQYGTKRGGAKGNVSFTSYDGLTKVEIRVQDHMTFGPELQIAKQLIDEYIEEVSEGVPDVVRGLLAHAFETDKVGQVNRDRLYALRRFKMENPHPKWTRAMDAIADAQRITGSKEYFQLSIRKNTAEGFKALPINLANAYEMERNNG